MKFLNRLFLILIVGFLLFTFGQDYIKQAVPAVSRWINFSFCDRPIKYRVGSIDPKFDITKEVFGKAIAEASEVWAKQYGHPLFVQDENGELEINLVYDGRQKLVSTINSLDSEVEAQKQRIDSENTAFDQAKTKLETEIKQLNDQIDYWNSKGGAPEDEYNTLTKKQKEIQGKIEALNKTVNQINSEVEKVNDQVHALNTNVNNFNSVIKVNPEVGVYTSGINKIDIFFFGSHEELVHVLAHEMGHALSLGHVEGQDSIMNPTNSSNLKLTEEDIKELTNVCTNKNRIDLIKNDIINYIYTIVSKYGKNL